MTPNSALTRARKATWVTLAVYALLVATHLGEFWPFSIYPMFSQGGHPWVRAVVRDVSSDTTVSWAEVSLDELPGAVFPLGTRGVNQNDVANFVSKSARWDEARLAAFRRLFDDRADTRRLMVYRVEGRLTEQEGAVVRYRPLILLDSTGARLKPSTEVGP